MGGRPAQPIQCPRGVSIREFTHERRIQIAFTFHKVECRELLPPGPITQSALTYAGGLRAEIQRKIANCTFQYADYFPASPRAAQFGLGGERITIGKLLASQQELYEKQTANKQLSPSTLAGYAKAIKSERMQFWKDRPVAAVTPSELRGWISGIDGTAKFVRNLMTPLRAVFEDALNDDLIKFNPFERIAMTKLLKKTTTLSDYEVDPFTAAERAELIKHARADEAPMVQFWFNSGLRPGELIAHKWPKVDWVHGRTRIDLNQVEHTEKDPKTAAGVRDVDLNPAALAALNAQKAFSFLKGEHIWLNGRTGKAWETDAQIRKTLWQPLCKRAGVRYRNPYQVRHTYASSMLTSGQNPWYVAQQLGHVDVQMVFKIYGKFIAEDFTQPKATGLRLVAGE